MTALTYERVFTHLDNLKLRRMAQMVDKIAEKAVKEAWSYLDFIDHLLAEEMSARYDRDVLMKYAASSFSIQ